MNWQSTFTTRGYVWSVLSSLVRRKRLKICGMIFGEIIQCFVVASRQYGVTQMGLLLTICVYDVFRRGCGNNSSIKEFVSFGAFLWHRQIYVLPMYWSGPLMLRWISFVRKKRLSVWRPGIKNTQIIYGAQVYGTGKWLAWFPVPQSAFICRSVARPVALRLFFIYLI